VLLQKALLHNGRNPHHRVALPLDREP
jgi:hypothetical protein